MVGVTDSGGCSMMAEYMVGWVNMKWNMMGGCSGDKYVVSQ